MADEYIPTTDPEDENPIPTLDEPEEPDPPQPPEPMYYYQAFTELGLAHLTKQQLKLAEPNITRAVIGAGYVDPNTLSQQIEVTDPIAEMEIGPKELIDGKVARITFRLRSDMLASTALFFRIGVYCDDPDMGEILYMLIQYEQVQSVPSVAANRGQIKVFDEEVNITFANAEAAAVPTSPGWFLNQADLEAHNRAPDAHLNKFIINNEEHDEFRRMLADIWAELELVKATLITDTEHRQLVTFADLSGVLLIRGVYNETQRRLEC